MLGCYQCPLILSKEPSKTIAISLGIGVVSNSGNPLGLAAPFPPLFICVFFFLCSSYCNLTRKRNKNKKTCFGKLNCYSFSFALLNTVAPCALWPDKIIETHRNPSRIIWTSLFPSASALRAQLVIGGCTYMFEVSHVLPEAPINFFGLGFIIIIMSNRYGKKKEKVFSHTTQPHHFYPFFAMHIAMHPLHQFP